MKRFVAIITALFLVFVLLGCSSQDKKEATGGRAVPGMFPEFVKNALMNAPEDVLVGVGTANLASLSQSRTISTNRARAEVARQINSMVQDMIRDYQSSSEVDPDAAVSFQENITVTLSAADVTGARVVQQDATQDGTVWTVVWMDKTTVAREITQAQAAARLAVPAMASFDAEARMNEAFARLYNAEVQVRERD